MSVQVEFQAIAPPLRWDEAGGIRIGQSRVTIDSLLAASENRILLTHDVATIIMYANDRIIQGLPMPGVFEVIATAPIGQVIDDLELLIMCSQPDEYENQILLRDRFYDEFLSAIAD